MSKIKEFVGAPKEFKYKGSVFKLYPLKVKDLEVLNISENASNKEKMEMSKKIIQKSLRDEDLSLEDISEMPAGLFTKIMNEINNLNGFEDDLGIVKEKLSR